MVAAVIGEFVELSGDYRIVLNHQPPYDFLPVQVELAKGQSAADWLGERIEQAIKSKLGATAKVIIMPEASFPVTEGKTRRVVRTHT
jgi:phenylacetate-CoA ligase